MSLTFTYPVSLDDVRAAEKRIRPFIDRTPLRSYPALDAAVGHGIRVLVKHENLRLILSTTHNLVEPARAVGLAGVFKLREELEGQTVCVILTGSNLDADTLRKVVSA